MQVELSFAAIQSLMLQEVREFRKSFNGALDYGQLHVNGDCVYIGEVPRAIAGSGFAALIDRISSASNLTGLDMIAGEFWGMDLQEWIDSYFRSLQD